MVIWSGHGYWVAVITFTSCLLFNYVLDSKFGETYYSTHGWAIGSALIVGGILSSALGFAFNWRSNLHDSESSPNTLFFVPMHWAGLVVTLIGVLIAVFGLPS